MTIPIHCSYTELRELANFVEHPRNPNKHPEAQLRLLGKIIATQGWRSPIVVSKRSGFIIKGHGRYQAALMAGMESAPVDLQEYATEADEWADMIADNRIAELAELNQSELASLLTELDGKIDLDLAGFDADALAKALSQFNADGIDAPELRDGDRAPFRQMTFTVHDEQFDEIEAAMKKAKDDGGGESAVNENSNGNALAFICRKFNNG